MSRDPLRAYTDSTPRTKYLVSLGAASWSFGAMLGAIERGQPFWACAWWLLFCAHGWFALIFRKRAQTEHSS